jgi:aldehyde:ferredoxin oxidoreductase
MFGWNGKVLQIDLSSLQTSICEPGSEIYCKYLGDKGLAGHYLKPYIVESQNSTAERVSALKGSGSIAVIGPAAENGVLYASIIFDSHYAAGRSGLVLVMAAKRLGFVTVQGTKRTSVYDRAELMGAGEEIFRLVRASPMAMGDLGLTNFGTAALFDLTSSRRMRYPHF